MFLINSRQGVFRCAPAKSKAYAGEALSRGYGRFFAEFLQELSPVRLGALTPAHLCRFCGTGPLLITLQGFSRKAAHPSSPNKWTSPQPLDFKKKSLGKGRESNNPLGLLTFAPFRISKGGPEY